MRKCRHCQQRFRPQRRHQRFCSASCRLTARGQRQNEQRYFARKRRHHAIMDGGGVACAVCGIVFVPQRSTKRFCSHRCQQRAFRARTPNAAQIEAAFERELGQLRQRLDTARRQRLMLAAAHGDQTAIDALHALRDGEA
jgi:endogenous inhibitor of DNA gyrase (YacG/DUF329 family)